ncbi:MAG: hypoxanthine phosphoribosyltransferase [Kiritimatiellaeota bacterium]|nr:hypoxanthine phosphoribosyltransferase [Kiritimatiellota bacterium]
MSCLLKPHALGATKALIDQNKLKSRVVEMGAEITANFADRRLTVIAVSNGAILFVADLVRSIDLPMQLDSITAYSYSGTKSSGDVKIFSDLKLDITGRSVLLVDDILDTGRTLSKIVEFLKTLEPSGVETCVLLDKPSRRVVDIKADYIGFEVPDVFVVGYGLDYNEYYRNLPYVAVIEPEKG